MTNQFPLPHPVGSASTEATALSLQAQDADVALGFECADPALQIERWGQEDAAPARLLA